MSLLDNLSGFIIACSIAGLLAQTTIIFLRAQNLALLRRQPYCTTMEKMILSHKISRIMQNIDVLRLNKCSAQRETLCSEGR